MDEVTKVSADIEAQKEKTELKKEQFIREIKSGLGDHIKHNGGRYKKIEKSMLRKFWEKLMRAF